jgi:hypothetical protein
MQRTLFVCLIALITGSAAGQKTSLGINLQLSFPQGEYKATYPKTGVGARFNVFYRPNPDGPLSIGGEFGYMVTSSDSRFFDIFYGGFYDSYQISASNNILSLAFKARADLLGNERPVRLFVEGTVGTNLFYSSVNIERQTYYGGSQTVDGDNSKGYWAFYGVRVWGWKFRSTNAGIYLPPPKDHIFLVPILHTLPIHTLIIMAGFILRNMNPKLT